MNQKALALLVTMMVCMPSAAYAARAYDGQPLATKNGPAYEPQTVDDVARRAAQAEAIRKLQDEPDQFAEEAVQAKQESEKEKKARQERGEDKAASESDLPITIYGDHVLYHSDTGGIYSQRQCAPLSGHAAALYDGSPGQCSYRRCVPAPRGPHD